MAKTAALLPGTLDMLILKAVSLRPLHGYGILLEHDMADEMRFTSRRTPTIWSRRGSRRDEATSMIAVISDAYWSRKFGRSSDVLGRTLTIGGKAVAIVGVTAAVFDGLIPSHKMDITLPISIRGLSNPRFFDARDTWTSLQLVGRLEENVSDEQSLAVVDATFKQFWMEPENSWARGGNSDEQRSALLLPASRGADVLRRQFAVPLRVLVNRG